MSAMDVKMDLNSTANTSTTRTNNTAFADVDSNTVWHYERALDEFDLDSVIVFVVFLLLLITTVVCINLVTPRSQYSRLQTSYGEGSGKPEEEDGVELQALDQYAKERTVKTDEEIAREASV
jgi:hypothetical protein